jgi:CDP-diacylglycerol---glycerol-3-phosphate 3-phosphatidyltransferase
MRLNLPNSITVARIFLVPLLVVVLLTPPWATAWVKSQLQDVGYAAWIGHLASWLSDWREVVGVAIFLTAAATDWLDGFVARRRGEITTFGQLLDPIADKLLTASAFISLVELQLAPAWMVVVIIGREFAVTGLRSVAATRGLVIAASPWGKLKTVTQIVAITAMILTSTLERWLRFGFLGVAALWVAMIVALLSAVDYFVRFAHRFDFEDAG